MAESDPPELRAVFGAAILRRYHHPDSWVAGENISQEYHGCMLLCVEEFRVGQQATVTLEEAKQNATDIVAFLRYLKLTRKNIWLADEPNKGPYLVVPIADGNWETVISLLRNL